MQRLLTRLLPFLFTFLIALAFIFGMVLLFYFFLFSLALGIVLSIYRAIRQRLRGESPPASQHVKQSHRVIDADEWKEL